MAEVLGPPSSMVVSPTVTEKNNPLPLSFPAILRNPGISDRFAHLRTLSSDKIFTASAHTKKNKRDEREGKRWIKRKENARFQGNPHIVLATRKDYSLPIIELRTTFPEPLPHYLPRTAKVPSFVPPARDPNSANAGRFSLSLKGMRRELRRSGTRAELLVREVEDEIVRWLREGGTVISPDGEDVNALRLPGTLIGTTETIREVSRTPLQLVWSMEEDAFARYVVHCCARYHEIVSFSKDVSGQRLTYLLRPNVTRPDFHAPANLDTPPITDYSSQFDTDSDFSSDREAHSDAGESEMDAHLPVQAQHPLSVISEASAPASPVAGVPATLESLSEDAWSVIGESDMEGDDEHALMASVESLSINEADRTLRSEHRVLQTSLRNRVWDQRHGRSVSSPSRSPARTRRAHLRVEPPVRANGTPRSFYDYLFL